MPALVVTDAGGGPLGAAAPCPHPASASRPCGDSRSVSSREKTPERVGCSTKEERMEGMSVELRVRLSAADVHYGGNLVDGAHGLELFGDIVTELAVRTDGDEGLFAGYEKVEFLAPLYGGDFVRATGHDRADGQHEPHGRSRDLEGDLRPARRERVGRRRARPARARDPRPRHLRRRASTSAGRGARGDRRAGADRRGRLHPNWHPLRPSIGRAPRRPSDIHSIAVAGRAPRGRLAVGRR